MRNLILVGGVHGAGKDFLINSIKDKIPFIHLSASKVLKWNEISPCSATKLVDSLVDTQERLVKNLRKAVKNNDSLYLLDGHFTLLNKNSEVMRVPADTFVQIAPMVLVVKTSLPKVISWRLQKRDRQIWEIDKVAEMQRAEIAYAHELAKKLKLPFYLIADGQENMLVEIILKHNVQNTLPPMFDRDLKGR